MRARQSGAALLIPVVLLITVAAFAVIVAASQSGGDIQGSDANADSLQALYVAETGIERALKRFATGTACGGALTEAITDLSTIGLGTTAYRINIGAGLATDFSGAALPATQCRVPITGTVLATNVSRTIHAIVDRNLLEGADNPNFNNPLTGAAPSGWTAINPANAFAVNGSPDGTAPNCRRSAWTARNNPGAAANNRRATATANVQFNVTAGSVTNITFHRRVITRPSDCGALPGAGPAALPGACAAATQSTVCFQLLGAGGPGVWTVRSNANPAGAGIAACPSTFNPCQVNYQAGYPTKISLNVTMTGATSVNQFRYYLQLQNAGRKELFLDSIEVTNPTAVGAAYVRVWRDCSTAVCP
jgi:hypothetical protein